MDYFSGEWKVGFLAHEMSYQEETFAAGTKVKFRPYPADPSYAEIGLPNGVYVTETYDRVTEEERAMNQNDWIVVETNGVDEQLSNVLVLLREEQWVGTNNDIFESIKLLSDVLIARESEGTLI